MMKRYFVTAGATPMHLGGTTGFRDFWQADGVAFDEGPKCGCPAIIWQQIGERRPELVAIWSRSEGA